LPSPTLVARGGERLVFNRRFSWRKSAAPPGGYQSCW
jgi:hypothetical protein